MKVRLSGLIESASGTIERHTEHDGTRVTTYLKKNGTLVTLRKAAPRPAPTPAQIEQQHRFGAISQAIERICKRGGMEDMPWQLKKYFHSKLREIYYQLPEDRDRERDGETLCEKFCERLVVIGYGL